MKPTFSSDRTILLWPPSSSSWTSFRSSASPSPIVILPESSRTSTGPTDRLFACMVLYPFLVLPDPVAETLVQGHFRPLSFVLVHFHSVDERLHEEQPPAARLEEVLGKRRI